MQILNLSNDSLALDETSVVAGRLRRYGEAVERYTVIVPSAQETTVRLSGNVTVHGTGGGSKVVRLYRLYKKAAALIADGAYDVVSSQDYYFLGLVGYVLARRHGLGLEVQVHGIEKLGGVRKRLAAFVLKRAGSIRVVSSRLERLVTGEFCIPAERIMRISIHVDVTSLGFAEAARSEEKRAALRAQYGDHFNFLTVSRLVPVKNIPLQLRAIATLRNEFPEVRLHIVGAGAETERARLAAEIERLGIEEHAVLHGPQFGAELGAFFAAADCFLLTSYSEGWGMAAIEAASAGLPVIMTDVGCAGEVIISGESGIVVPVDDEEALVASMRRVILDRALRERLGAKAKPAAAGLPGFEAVIAQYRESWERALKNSQNAAQETL